MAKEKAFMSEYGTKEQYTQHIEELKAVPEDYLIQLYAAGCLDNLVTGVLYKALDNLGYDDNAIANVIGKLRYDVMANSYEDLVTAYPDAAAERSDK